MLGKLLLLLITAAAATTSSTQTASPPSKPERTIHVDGRRESASDSNPGTDSAPIKTLAKASRLALALNAQNIPVRIVIRPGVYRESIVLPQHGKETAAPITIEAAEKHAVIIDGADEWTSWQPSSIPHVYTHEWREKWGAEPTPPGWPPTPEILRRREILLVNGKLLTPVTSLDQLVDNTFFVDDILQKVTMRLPADVEPSLATIEWGMRGNSIRIEGKANLTIRGLVIQHDASPFNKGEAVSFANCLNPVMEDCIVQWNGQGGILSSYTRGAILRRVTSSNNGGAGFGGTRMKDILVEDCTANSNNWRGALADFTGWAYAGLKHLHTHGGVYRNFTATDNRAYGLWLDTDCTDITVERAQLHRNVRDGIFVEANQGPITIKDSVITRNTLYGIRSANSARVTLDNNVLYANWSSDSKTGAQINISGDNIGRPIKDFETKQAMTTQSEHWTLTNNKIVGTSPRQLFIRTDLNADLWSRFATTLTADKNLWWNPSVSDAFSRDGGKRMDLDAWRVHTGQEAGGISADPRFSDPTHNDFNRAP